MNRALHLRFIFAFSQRTQQSHPISNWRRKMTHFGCYFIIQRQNRNLFQVPWVPIRKSFYCTLHSENGVQMLDRLVTEGFYLETIDYFNRFRSQKLMRNDLPYLHVIRALMFLRKPVFEIVGVLGMMEEDGIEPTVTIHQQILKSFIWASDIIGMVQYYQSLKPSILDFELSEKFLMGMIESEGHVEEVIILYFQIFELGYRAGCRILWSLILCLAKNNKNEEMIRCFSHVRYFLKGAHWLYFEWRLSGFLAKIEDLELFKRICDSIQEYGFECSLRTWTGMISGYGSRGDYFSAFNLLGKMREKGLRPDLNIYNTMLRVLGDNQQLGLQTKVFEMMKSDGVIPDSKSYYFCVSLLGRFGLSWEILDMFDTMMEQGINPSLGMILLVMDLFEEEDNWEEIENLFWKVDRLGFVLDADHFSLMISHLFQIQDEERFWYYYEQMRERNVRPNYTIYNLVIRAFVQKGDFGSCWPILKEMVERGMDLMSLFSQMIGETFRRGSLEDCMQLVDVMESDPYTISNSVLWEKMLHCCKDYNMPSIAQHIQNLMRNLRQREYWKK